MIRFRPCLFPAMLVAGWILALPLACATGPVHIDFSEIFRILLFQAGLINAETDSLSQLIVIQLRLARALTALFCGGALAMAGTALQGCLRNPLADPFTLGISAGAAFGASLALTVPNFPAFGMPTSALAGICAVFGSFIALGATLAIGRAASGSRENIILAGIATATFLGAIVALIKALNEESVTSIVFWLMGSLQGRSWSSLILILGAMIPGLFLIVPSWRKLDLFLLGDEQAHALGMNPPLSRFLLLLGASCMTAGCVASCGIIGFVGLVVPHLIRLSLGPAHGPLLICAFFGGGLFLLAADCLARIALPSGQELPAGVVTALAGGPFFAFLVWRSR